MRIDGPDYTDLGPALYLCLQRDDQVACPNLGITSAAWMDEGRGI